MIASVKVWEIKTLQFFQLDFSSWLLSEAEKMTIKGSMNNPGHAERTHIKLQFLSGVLANYATTGYS